MAAVEYYFEKLNDAQKKAYKDIYNAFRVKSEMVRVPGTLKKEQFIGCIEAVQYDYPEFFYIDFKTITYRVNPDYYEYTPRYIYCLKEINEKKQRIDERVASIVRMINERPRNIYQKCGFLHDYMVKNCTYNDDALKESYNGRSAYSIEGFFLENTAVCQGIAFAYRYICRALNIDAVVARGFSLHPGCRDYERHAWNLIRVGEAAAFVDVTWDMCLTSKGKVRYDYFFLPDIEMMRDHQYVGYPTCRNLQSSYFERAGRQFLNLEMLEKYVIASLSKREEVLQKGLYLQFKMKNRKENIDEVVDFVRETVKKEIKKGFSSTWSVNDIQSVFEFHIMF